jgi:cell division protein FtsB
MRKISKWFLVFCFLIEITAFTYYFMWGERGVVYSYVLMEEERSLKRGIQTLKQDNEKLQNEIDDWKKYAYYTEKYARERLQLMKPGEEIFFIVT